MAELIPIESSMIQAVSYDETEQSLLILFNSGKAYRYFQIPKALFEELLASDSKGSFMRDRIIDQYPWEFAKKRR